MEKVKKPKIRIGGTVRDILYYGKGNFKAEDRKKLKELKDVILEKGEIGTTELEEMGKILVKYNFSVRSIYQPEHNTLTIMFYDESKIKEQKTYLSSISR